MIPPLAAIFAWPAISAVLFKQQNVAVAILATIIGGYLLLPGKVALDLPMLPPLDKATVPALACLVFVMFSQNAKSELKGLLPRHWMVRTCLLLLGGGAFATVLTNPDPLTYGDRYLAGLKPYDGFSAVLGVIMVMIPVILARRYLATPERHRLVLLALALAGLGYSVLAAFEVRMSPQLNSWIYGFFAHDWRQHVRSGGGFRPIVFLSHGLLVSIFLSGCVLAAIGLFRQSGHANRAKWALAIGWLFVVMVLTKSLGAVLITAVLLPIALFLSTRLQLMAAAMIGMLILVYPMLRSNGWVPTEQIVTTIAQFSEDRASSFQTRLDNEDNMLDKVTGRGAFGWGGYGRSRVFDTQGNDITIADGYWIIILGVGGWARYIGEYGLLTIPLMLLFFQARRGRIGLETSILALILAGNLVDTIPNSSITPLSWLMAGALWGRLEIGADVTTGQADTKTDVQRPLLSRSRPLAGPVLAQNATANGAMADSGPDNTTPSPYTRQHKRVYRKH